MRVLQGDSWRDGYLDFHRAPSEYRIAVKHWRTVERLQDVYFVRPRSARMLLSYLREVGPRAVARKIRSRLDEAGRNDKYMAIGAGVVVEGPGNDSLRVGAEVVFVAPCHPRCVDRVVLSAALVFPVEAGRPPSNPTGTLRFSPAYCPCEDLAALRGWSPFSGRTIEPGAARRAGDVARRVVEARWPGERQLLVDDSSPQERVGSRRSVSRGAEFPSAMLFGWGNYAKTTVVPRIQPFMDLHCVHELDPTQMPRRAPKDLTWDTAPERRSDEHFDVHLIAGFHHMHAPLARQALDAGAHAVVEKPIATKESQLDDLVAAMQTARSSLFACFHKRYLPFNDLALHDLDLRPGEPLSYHCIVFEEPLPDLHWYRWPNSRSRLTSNGCHWIDHFLFLSGYASPSTFAVSRLPDGALNCTMSLDNGAAFTMVLTDRGSRRLGVQDHVELRANGVTVTIRNGTHYRAEDGLRVLRRKRSSRLASYDEMYRSIGSRIRAGTSGDSSLSVDVSTRAVLRFEDELHSSEFVPQ